MSDPFIYYVKDADKLYEEQLSFRFAACSRQADTIIVTEDLKNYCNLVDSAIKNYLKAKSVKDTLLSYKRHSESRKLNKLEEEKIIKLREVRETASYLVNLDMKKVCEMADRLSLYYYEEINDCDYIGRYDNEKKVLKFIKKE